MSKYDWDANYVPGEEYTLKELCYELIDTNITAINENVSYAKNHEYNSIRHRFTNTNGNGIINRLLKYCNYDIEKNADDKSERIFEMCKLLKALYQLENKGVFPCGEKINDSDKFNFINILSKPRIEHIKSVSSNYYRCVGFNKLKDDIKLQIDTETIKRREKDINLIFAKWDKITDKVYDCCRAENIYVIPEFYLDLIQKINSFFENVLKTITIPKNSIEKQELLSNASYNEGIFLSFFNILQYYSFRCYDEQISIENSITPKEFVSSLISSYYTYYGRFINYKVSITTTKNLLSEMNRNTLIDEMPESCKALLSLLHAGSYIDDYEKYNEKIKYALKRADRIILLIRNYLHEEITSDIDILLLTAIIQEIISVYDEKQNHFDTAFVTNDPIGFTNSKISLNCIFNTKRYNTLESVPEIIKIIWIRRVINRQSINVGGYENVLEFIEIEKTIFKIKHELTKYKNFKTFSIITHLIEGSFSYSQSKKFSPESFNYFFNEWKKICENG